MNNEKILKNQKYLFSILNKIKKKYPYLTVIILHEYFRNLFPQDPYIKFKILNPKKRIYNLQISLIKILKNFKNFGSYIINFKNYNLNEELKKKLERFMVDFGENLQIQKITMLKILF